MHELNRDMLRVGGACTIAKGQQAPARVKAPRHVPARLGNAPGLGGEKRLGHGDASRKARRDDAFQFFGFRSHTATSLYERIRYATTVHRAKTSFAPYTDPFTLPPLLDLAFV